MKVLIHICCAPCLIYPLEVLRLKGFESYGLFFNPNIHPFTEYNERKKAITELNSGIEVIYPDYLPQEFFRGINFKEDTPLRCTICWGLRLKKTARIAKERGFKYFTTTLLVSPYQNHEVLRKLGDEAAREEGVEFYYADFRPGFKKAHEEAKRKGIYAQKYCGCIYSEMERYSKKYNA
ncbi:MAG: epoxyqueuosine reductase QueH [Candidatus Omnitrophica bacterium]|nr:epoxyqueuosine reductase QueH [Candidatus Omnitrophota bacterium]